MKRRFHEMNFLISGSDGTIDLPHSVGWASSSINPLLIPNKDDTTGSNAEIRRHSMASWNVCPLFQPLETSGRLNIKVSSYQYRDPNV